MAINNSKELTRGDTGMYSVTLYDGDGAQYIPSEGEALTFYLMKKNCDDLTEAILVKDIPVDTMHLMVIYMHRFLAPTLLKQVTKENNNGIR